MLFRRNWSFDIEQPKTVETVRNPWHLFMVQDTDLWIQPFDLLQSIRYRKQGKLNSINSNILANTYLASSNNARPDVTTRLPSNQWGCQTWCIWPRKISWHITLPKHFVYMLWFLDKQVSFRGVSGQISVIFKQSQVSWFSPFRC